MKAWWWGLMTVIIMSGCTEVVEPRVIEPEYHTCPPKMRCLFDPATNMWIVETHEDSTK